MEQSKISRYIKCKYTPGIQKQLLLALMVANIRPFPTCHNVMLKKTQRTKT